MFRCFWKGSAQCLAAGASDDVIRERSTFVVVLVDIILPYQVNGFDAFSRSATAMKDTIIFRNSSQIVGGRLLRQGHTTACRSLRRGFPWLRCRKTRKSGQTVNWHI